MQFSNIFVTGGAGYIGSLLIPALVREKYKVSVIDNLTFGNNLQGKDGFTLYERDALDLDPNWLEGVDVLIHLAGLSNDPMANFRPRLRLLLVLLLLVGRLSNFLVAVVSVKSDGESEGGGQEVFDPEQGEA